MRYGMCGLVVFVLVLGGCPSQEMARQGVPQRGPVELSLEKDENGNIRKLAGKTSGGTTSVVHYERTSSSRPDGTKDEHVLATSDPTLVMQIHYDAVANQSRVDTANIIGTVQALSAEMKSFIGIAREIMAERRATPPPPDGPPPIGNASGGLKGQLLQMLLDPAKRGELLADPAVRALLGLPPAAGG